MDLQIGRDGMAVPPEEWSHIYVGNSTRDLPMAKVKVVAEDAALPLYDLLRQRYSHEAYMASVMMGGK